MNRLNLNELQNGDIIRGEVGVIDSSIRSASNGNYLVMTVTDGVTNIEAKIWKYSEITIPAVGATILLVGSVNEYKGKLDLNCKSWSLTNGDINNYRKKSENDTGSMLSDILEIIYKIQDEDLRCKTLSLICDYKLELLVHPAAKLVHHDYVGGLIHHMLEVVSISITNAEVLSRINPSVSINMDKVIVGALLHDIGKLRSYCWEGLAPVMSNSGKFNDHIVEGIQMLTERDFTPEWLIHIVASHHGKLEYGSPVLPATIEAYIISEADMLSSKAAIFIEEMKTGNGWSDKKNYFIGRTVHRG